MRGLVVEEVWDIQQQNNENYQQKHLSFSCVYTNIAKIEDVGIS